MWGWLTSTSRIPLRFSTCFDSVSTVSPLSFIFRNFVSLFFMSIFVFVAESFFFRHFPPIFFVFFLSGWGQCCHWPKRHLLFSIFERDVSCVLRWWEKVGALKADLLLSILFFFVYLLPLWFFLSSFWLSLTFFVCTGQCDFVRMVCTGFLHRLFASWLMPFSDVALKLSSFFPSVFLVHCSVGLALLLFLFHSIPFLTFVSVSSSSLYFLASLRKGTWFQPSSPFNWNLWRNRYCMMEWMWRQLLCLLLFPAFFIRRAVLFPFFLRFCFIVFLTCKSFFELRFVLLVSVSFLNGIHKSSCCTSI